MGCTVTTIYIGCALVGGTILVLQLLLMLFGGDFDVDDVDVGDIDIGDGGFHVLSLRAIAGFLTFFGLVGWWGSVEGWGAVRTLLSAAVAGGTMMMAVAWLFSLQRRLHAQGNIDSQGVVGLPAKVYLRVPAARSGTGKITVAIQGRSMEFPALTAGPEIATGTDVRVVAMTTEGTFEVTRLTDEGEPEA